METYHEILKRLETLKKVELRAVGKAIGNAISLSEKITNESNIKFNSRSCCIHSNDNIIV